MEKFTCVFPNGIPWGTKPRPLICRIAWRDRQMKEIKRKPRH